MNLRTTLTSVALGAAVFAGSTLLAAPAQAAAPRPTLRIVNAGGGWYDLYIFGQSGKPNASYGVRVFGEDTFFDDFIASRVGYLRTDYDGYFSMTMRLTGDKLDEDWGRDEIFAKVDISGVGSLRTNTVTGYY